MDLETHIADICNVLEYRDLRDVVLVGHSYGGIVVTGVAGQAPNRLAHLLYLDAVLPVDGKAYLEVVPPAERAAQEERTQQNDGWRVPPPVLPAEVAQRWPFSLMTPQPFKTLTQPLRLRNPEALADLPKTYVLCTEGKHRDRWRGELGARGMHGPAWHYEKLPTGHFPMLTMRSELADLLNAAAVPVST